MKKKTDKNLLMQFQLFIVYKPDLFTERFSQTRAIHPGIFLGRALQWADNGSPRMNAIASRDKFKPIRIGENLIVNYMADSVRVAQPIKLQHLD